MKMRIGITPLSNVNFDKQLVLDEQKVSSVILDWDDVIRVFNVELNKEESKFVRSLSLFKHRLIKGGTQYVVLNALSKESFEENVA